ncbi:MAG: hypothetical protein ACP5JF_03650 [Candidatus Methanodesulfokora sp.]|jgi:hypothetical protein
MRYASVLLSFLSIILILSGIILLDLTKITIKDLIAMDIDSTRVFMRSLMNDTLIAVYNFFLYYVEKFASKVFIPLLLLCSGVAIPIYFFDRINKESLFIGLAMVFLMVSYITQSIALSMAVLGVIGSIAIFIRGSEERNKFLRMYSRIRTAMTIIALVLILGISMSIYIYFPKYNTFIKEKNLDLMVDLTAGAGGLDVQKKSMEEIISSIMNGVRSGITQEYGVLSQKEKECCSSYKTALMAYVDNYERLLKEQIERENETQVRGVIAGLPIFKALINATPLTIYLTGIFAFELLNYLISAIVVIVMRYVYLSVVERTRI